MGRLHKACESRDRAPGDQDACDPDTRADPVKYQVAGNLKQEVSPEENSSSQSELLARDGQRPIHRQRRKAQVDSVDEGDHVKCKQERQQTDLEFPDRCFLDRVRSSAIASYHAHSPRKIVRINLSWRPRSPTEAGSAFSAIFRRP